MRESIPPFYPNGGTSDDLDTGYRWLEYTMLPGFQVSGLRTR